MTHEPTVLGYAFRRPELLRQALTHRSFGAGHNERLEFVGDAVLNCAIAAVLYERFPQIPEGDLSRVRASLVNGDTLARLGAALDLGGAIRLGEGEYEAAGRAPVDPRRRTSRRCWAPYSSTPVSTRRAVSSTRVFAAESRNSIPTAPSQGPEDAAAGVAAGAQARRAPFTA